MIKRRKFNMQEQALLAEFQGKIKDLESCLDNFPNNREKRIVIQKLDEAAMWAGACIANEEKAVPVVLSHTCDTCRYSRPVGGHLRCGLIFDCVEENDEAVIIAPKICPIDFGKACTEWMPKK